MPQSKNTFTTTRYAPPMDVGLGGAINYSYGPEPFFRDGLDSRRSMQFQTPDAQYPDGYLGTIRTRRDDRLLGALKDRQNQRSYQRGVHKGERIDPGDYEWPKKFSPMAGLERQARSAHMISDDPVETRIFVDRFAPTGTLNEQHLASEGRMVPRGAYSLFSLQRGQAKKLQHLAPPWR